jgi:hypothetical protein
MKTSFLNNRHYHFMDKTYSQTNTPSPYEINIKRHFKTKIVLKLLLF